MRRLLFVIMFCALWQLQPAIGRCSTLTPLEIAQRIQETYEKTTAFQADFQQSSSVSDMGHRQRRGSGTMVIQKPSLLRWDYLAPDKQVLVSDGKMFYLYVAAENQMIVTPAKEYLQEDVTYNFFAGKGNLIQDFEISALPEELQKEGSLAIRLIPKKTYAQVASLNMWVDKGTYLINRLEIFDHLGGVTKLTLSNIKVNNPLPLEYFHFTPPAGTEIIEQ